MPASTKFEDLAELLGTDAAATLCEKMGGDTVHIPEPGSRRKGFAALVDVLGETGAMALCERYSGELLYIPMARNRVAPLLHAQGASVREIAERLGITRSGARRILKRAAAA